MTKGDKRADKGRPRVFRPLTEPGRPAPDSQRYVKIRIRATFVDFANRVVNHFLDGVGAALTAETLERYDLDRVWDDRVLRHAAIAFGGVPIVELVDAERSVPAGILDGIRGEIALPKATA